MITIWEQAFKGYGSSHRVQISNPVNTDLELKDVESAIKNKLKTSFSKLREFKFVTTLVLVL